MVPGLHGATVAGRTLAARTVGADLYDFLDLGQERIGILCADVSGKRNSGSAHDGEPAGCRGGAPRRQRRHSECIGRRFVGILNQELTGRFGDYRYATLFWAAYNADTSVLTYVNAGNPLPILIKPGGEIERLDSCSFPIGMFANARYTSKTFRCSREAGW